MQQSGSPGESSVDVDDIVVLFPSRLAAPVPTELPAQSAAQPAADPQVRVRTRVIDDVVVLEVAGTLGDVVQDLDRAIQLALADGPRGVACDLTAVLEDPEPGAIEVLATAGRHVRDWPGIPVAVACPDPRVRAVLAAHHLGRHLIVTASILPAVAAILKTPVPVVERLRLAPHPTAPRASRNFVIRTLLGWGLGSLSVSAGLVISELVANSTMHAATDIDLSVAWNMGALRVTVGDRSPERPCQRYSHFHLYGRGLSVVAGLARDFGVLPTAEGGKVVWAVLDSTRPRPYAGEAPVRQRTRSSALRLAGPAIVPIDKNSR
jgi:hypothetical protein